MNPGTALEILRARYRPKALAPDMLFLLDGDDALGFLDEATAEGCSLAGIDGFSVTDAGAYMPRQEFSNDRCDWTGTQSEFLRGTKELICEGAASGVRFEIIFEGEGLPYEPQP